MESTKFKYGDRLKELRKPKNQPDKNLSMDELSEKLSSRFNLRINKSMISRWENGSAVPDNKHISAYAIFFDVDMNYLIGLTDIKRKLSEINTDKNLSNNMTNMINELNQIESDKASIIYEIVLKLKNVDIQTLNSYNSIIK